MLHYKDVGAAQKLCECLAAPARVEILKLILAKRAESLDSLAKTLHLTNGAITQHVKKLCELGLVKLIETPGKRGIAKRCVVAVDRIIIDVATDLEDDSVRVFDIPIGSFFSASVNPYCALASASGWIGERDDPRYFTYPERTDAALIYFNSGKIGWTLPAPDKKTKLSSLSLSFEISSKPYGRGRSRDTAVTFFINDVKLGEYFCDGEFTDRKGLYTPAVFDDVCQYGKFRTLRIDNSGTFIDGVKIGSHTIDEFDSEQLAFYMSADNGLAIFGNEFGDYDCGIRCRLEQG